MTETTTEDAGRHRERVLTNLLYTSTDDRPWNDDLAEEWVARIEREARNALRAELRAGVEGLPKTGYAILGGPDMVDRAAVLDLIGEDES